MKGTPVSLLDADITPERDRERNSSWLGLLVWAGAAALVLAVGLAFLFAPKPVTQAVRQMVQAAEALVTKNPPKQPAEEESVAGPLARTKQNPPRAAGTDKPGSLASSPATQDLAVPPPAVPQGSPLRHKDLPPGTERARVRELLGQPDLTLYSLEKGHVVEHFVYVSEAQGYATSVMLIDGRVVSVNTGTPSVTPKGKSARGDAAVSWK
jgi:hypothetical protein